MSVGKEISPLCPDPFQLHSGRNACTERSRSDKPRTPVITGRRSHLGTSSRSDTRKGSEHRSLKSRRTAEIIGGQDGPTSQWIAIPTQPFCRFSWRKSWFEKAFSPFHPTVLFKRTNELYREVLLYNSHLKCGGYKNPS